MSFDITRCMERTTAAHTRAAPADFRSCRNFSISRAREHSRFSLFLLLFSLHVSPFLCPSRCTPPSFLFSPYTRGSRCCCTFPAALSFHLRCCCCCCCSQSSPRTRRGIVREKCEREMRAGEREESISSCGDCDKENADMKGIEITRARSREKERDLYEERVDTSR